MNLLLKSYHAKVYVLSEAVLAYPSHQRHLEAEFASFLPLEPLLWLH